MNATQTGHRHPFLRDKLAKHVLLPLAMVWALGSLVSAGIAHHFTEKVFDRSMLDDAYALSAHVHPAFNAEGQLEIELSSNEIATLLFDQSESVFFAIYRQDGSLLAGHPGLNAISYLTPDRAGHEFLDTQFNGQPVRALVLQHSQPMSYRVVIAQTTGDRQELLKRLLVYSVLPELLLFVLLAFWLNRAIQRDMQPLLALEKAVEERDEADLTPVVFEATSQDVVNLGQAVNDLLQRIQRGLNAQKEFSGNVAHELRTPLAGMRALAELGLQSKTPDTWHKHLQLIRESSMKASHLADQLLAWALADEMELGWRMEPVRLDELVTMAVLRNDARARALDVDLGAEGVDEPVTVLGHAALIEGILNNLLENALRYGKPAPDTPAVVTVAVRRQGDRVGLTVSDNGPGLAPEEHGRLLQRGIQGAPGKQHGQGLGLGLSIVTRYAHLMQAKFTLAQPPDGHGLQAEVEFQLPPEVR